MNHVRELEKAALDAAVERLRSATKWVRGQTTPTTEYARLWSDFQKWEDRAARNGSGMTREQITGASMMLGWLVERDLC